MRTSAAISLSVRAYCVLVAVLARAIQMPENPPTPAPKGVSRTRTVQGWFADDGALVVDSLRALQQAFTVGSAMARVLGFTVGIDADNKGVPTGDKTGWMGCEWRDGAWTEMGDDVTIRLVDGRAVPRVKEFYKHLGIRQPPKADWTIARKIVTNRCGGIASALSRLGILSAEEYVETVDAATTTVVAYYGATFPIGRQACEMIDVAKRRGLARLGHAGERTSRWLAHAPRPRGLGMAMTWPHAAAALVVEVDRALNMPETAPAHVATASRIAKEFWRWGWRPNKGAHVPLAWNPTWMRESLTEEGIIEAWQFYLQIAEVQTRTSDKGSGAADALADGYRMPADPEGADAPVWEREGRMYGRRLARLGGTLRKHFLADNGGWRSEKELGEYLGRGGRIVGGHRIGAKLTTAEAREYQTLLRQFQPDEHAWAATQHPGPRERPAEVRAVDVICAGNGAADSAEYLIEFSDGTTRWGRRPKAMAPGVMDKLRDARENYLEEGERTIEQFAEDLLEGTEAWWLATRAPLAVGARAPQDISAEAAREIGKGWWRPGKASMSAQERLGPGANMIQGARRAADEAKADATRADAAMTDGTTTPSEQATLAEAAETAWAWAAAMEDVAAYLEAPPDEREERKPPMDRAYAEYIAAAARAATGNYAEAVVAWARALPEHGLAARENAEGANAATEADARAPAKRFRPSARPECFMGTLMPADDNGKRHMRPSLELTEAQRRAAATLPPDMPVPDERDMRRDPRVAWKDDWHMWNDTPRRLGWKLSEEQLEQVHRQRLAALERRAAARPTRQHSGTSTIAGAHAAETANTEGASGQAHGTNRARQQLTEAMAAEARADEAACAHEPWPSEWGVEELERAEREAAGAMSDEDVEMRIAADHMEAYDEAERMTHAYLCDDTEQDAAQHELGHARSQTATMRRHVAGQHTLACERRLQLVTSESLRHTAALTKATAEAEHEWQRMCAEALEARRIADERASQWNDVRLSVMDIYRDSSAKDTERNKAARRVTQARDAENATREAGAAQIRGAEKRLRQTRAELARMKRACDEAALVTDAEREALESEEREEEQEREASRLRAVEHATRQEAARATRLREMAAAEKLQIAREATTEALRTLDGSDERARRKARATAEHAAEEEKYAHVEYWDALTTEQRAAILASPTLRLCARHRDMEQSTAARATDRHYGGVDISMEPKERRNIDTTETKHAAAVGLAIEQRYGIQFAYAVDGSKDDVEAWGDGATGERAAAWGAWDGTTAYGGALPPGTGNQEAELFAVERILARHTRGDRVLIMCDCQAALAMAESTWQSGRIGTGSPADGRTGGLLIEAITRHRLRITSRIDDSKPRGCVCFVWIKAHGGGVAPNAYADAIAKSYLTADVDYATVDAPYLALPRVCLYVAQPTPHEGTWEVGSQQYTCIAADRSLRSLIVDGMTRQILAHLPRQSHGHCDARVATEVTHTQGRPAGATPGAMPRHGVTEPTTTGSALRLRSNDLRQQGMICPLCHAQGPLEGDHILQCEGIPKAKRDEAVAKMTSALEAAANALPSGQRDAPADNTRKAWTEAARRAGQHGAAAALGPAPTEIGTRTPAHAREWARSGWKTKDDVYELSMREDAANIDKRLAAWCAVAICSAHAAAVSAASAGDATDEVAQACDEAVRKLQDGPLGSASRAAGDATVDGVTGTPYIPQRGADEGHISAIRMRFSQLQRHTQLAHVHEWTGRRAWLPSERRKSETATWTAHTHRGFREGGGAAGRKEAHAVAVDAHETVYSIAATARWPWLVEYELDAFDATRTDGTKGQRTSVTVQLGYSDGEMTARVRARHVQADGQRYRSDDTAISAEMELIGDHEGRGLRALFWDIAMGTHDATHGAQATVRRATGVRCVGGSLHALRLRVQFPRHFSLVLHP